MKKAIFKGRITTKTPLCIMLPESDEPPCLVATIGSKTFKIPVLPGNSLRGMLRKELAYDMLHKFNNQLDYVSTVFITNGGVVDPKKPNSKKDRKKDEAETTIPVDRKFQILNQFKARHLIADLFGGSLTGFGMIQGRLITEYAWLDCRELTGDENLPSCEDVYCSEHAFIRGDATQDEYEYFIKLSEQGQSELHERIGATVERQKKQSQEESEHGVKKKVEKEEPETSRHLGYIHKAIAPGVSFNHIIEIKDPKPRDIGAIAHALKKFTGKAQLGGYKRFGWGKIEFRYHLYTIDIEKSEGEEIGFIEGGYKRITSEEENGQPVLIDTYCYVEDPMGKINEYISVYQEYIDNLKVEDITVPRLETRKQR